MRVQYTLAGCSANSSELDLTAWEQSHLLQGAVGYSISICAVLALAATAVLLKLALMYIARTRKELQARLLGCACLR